MFKVELISEAENGLSDAYDWYKNEQPLLGEKLFKEITHYLNLIENNPYRFRIKYAESLRAALSKKFPYQIIFWIDEQNQIVFVTSIFDTRRNSDF